MSFIKELLQGVRSYFEANRVIVKYNLWPYIVIPGIISLCYIILLIVMGVIYFGDISGYVNNHWIPARIKGGTIMMLTNILLWMMMMLIGYVSYKHIVLIFNAPLLSYLSEVVEKAVYNQPAPDFTLKNLVKDIIRGLIINIRNLVMTIILTFLAWLLMFIPIIGVSVSTPLIFLIQFFYNGFGLIDYTLERKRYSVRESITFVHNNRPMVIGVGIGFMVLITIPVIGWFTAPAYGTVAATLTALEKIDGE